MAAAPLRERTLPFTAGDGMPLSLVHVRAEAEPTKGPVLLVHGAGVRADIFRAPTRENLVDYLARRGYDVWLENWRASIDVPRNEWTLDQAARHDHPRAVEAVVAETGAESVQAVIHCQGSTSFMLSAVAGLVPRVRTVVSNAVSLHPVVPAWSRFKLGVVVPLVGTMTDYLNPQWDRHAESRIGRVLHRVADLTHRECDNAVCKQVSFYYGSGFPALWEHDNLDDATHDWLRTEFADVPMSFYRQIVRGVRAGHLVPDEPGPDLPADIATRAPETDARFAFFAGTENRCFLPESQVRTHAAFEAREPGRHALHVLPGYSHLDVFMGHAAADDVFPLIESELAAA
ncbi:esterase/lipase family protein [Rubrivirga sp. IMCC45206]|uniref:esterase/lipase family protein n=1 Tax=Rubrivirga sp. IMCC45206 TaxID=3391614 RepID=UPI00398FE2F0